MIVLTGGAGFIGSCILAWLNRTGREEILVVDSLEPNDLKKANLKNKKFKEFIDKKAFINQVKKGRWNKEVATIIHMGACSSTTLQDAKYFEENNFQYSKILAQWALAHQVRFIYASSAATYGDGECGYKDAESEIKKLKPLNLYGQSKQKFDEWVLDQKAFDRVVGLKFFNVFGPNEYHKEDMRSVIAKAYDRVASEGKMVLFKSYHPDYKDGEQKRDFVYVKDAVKVMQYFFENPNINGLFNVGSGMARTWNDLAAALFKAVGKEPNIEYIDMPEVLKPRYQYFTQADMSKLFQSGYRQKFTSLEDAVKDYAGYLRGHRYE